ncbi:MAG: hypothetical protein BWY25_02912 [Chloroflexi bacterium ADurb.Bin222]|nr:MAG: hypothetical protein BWY25_02912 [Chloroflexi bacterium ADurb.Bin222]
MCAHVPALDQIKRDRHQRTHSDEGNEHGVASGEQLREDEARDDDQAEEQAQQRSQPLPAPNREGDADKEEGKHRERGEAHPIGEEGHDDAIGALGEDDHDTLPGANGDAAGGVGALLGDGESLPCVGSGGEDLYLEGTGEELFAGGQVADGFLADLQYAGLHGVLL